MVQIIWSWRNVPTGTKTDADSVSMEELQKIRAAVSLPIVVIGGINKGNAWQFQAHGN